MGRIVTATAASATVARYSETTKIKAQARFSGTQLRTILEVCSEGITTPHPIASHLEEQTPIQTVEHLFLVETHLHPIICSEITAAAILVVPLFLVPITKAAAAEDSLETTIKQTIKVLHFLATPEAASEITQEQTRMERPRSSSQSCRQILIREVERKT